MGWRAAEGEEVVCRITNSIRPHRMGDGEDVGHVRGEQVAKTPGVGRYRTTLVRLQHEAIAHRLASLRDTGNPQGVAVGAQERRDDRNALPASARSALCARTRGLRNPAATCTTTVPADSGALKC